MPEISIPQSVADALSKSGYTVSEWKSVVRSPEDQDGPSWVSRSCYKKVGAFTIQFWVSVSQRGENFAIDILKPHSTIRA